MMTEHTGRRPEAEGTPPADRPARTVGETQADEDLAELSADELRAKVAEARESAARNRQHFLHSVADLENYKKQAARERQDAVERTRRQMLSLVLSVLDNLERVLALAAEQDGASKALVNGLRMTHRQILDQLAAIGVRPIQSRGKRFDPHLHEAVAVVPPQGSEAAGGTIADEILRGYLLNEDVFRPAKVTVVAERTAEEPAEGDGSGRG